MKEDLHNLSLWDLTEEQKARFKELFRIEENGNDSNGTTFREIFALDLTIEPNLRYNEFMEYFYVSIKSVNEKMMELNTNISQKKYHYIHGNGKNGKTTFNKRFILENTQVFNSFWIDFSDSTLNKTNYSHRLILVIIKYFNLLVREHRNCVDTMMECINHITIANKRISERKIVEAPLRAISGNV